MSCAAIPGANGSECTFNGAPSFDPDGSIVSWVWNSGNRPTKTGAVVAYKYPSGSSPSITLVVTDNQGATGSKTVSFTIP